MACKGSRVVYCPDCGAPHLARVMARRRGAWWIRCRFCGPVAWRAVL